MADLPTGPGHSRRPSDFTTVIVTSCATLAHVGIYLVSFPILAHEGCFLKWRFVWPP